MLLTTIDELLEMTDADQQRIQSHSWGESDLLSRQLCLVIWVAENGQVDMHEDFGAEWEVGFVNALGQEMARRLTNSQESIGEVETPDGARLALGMRLPNGIVACLIRPPDSVEERDTLDHVPGVICGALAKAYFQMRVREGEWHARNEQLVASHESLSQSYSRNLVEAIEEHEQRILERHATERELQRLNACNRLILDSVGDGIVGMDANGCVTFVNPAAERMVGWTSTEMVGRPLHDFLHHTHTNGEAYDWECCPVHQTLRDGHARTIEDEFFWREDGSAFPTEYVSTPMFEDNVIVGAALTFQDVTQRRVLEGQLLQSQKLESIGQLAAGIAHEINTPTQFICDNLHFLEDGFTDLKRLLHVSCEACRDDLSDSDPKTRLAAIAAAAHDADLEYLLEEIPSAIRQSIKGVNRVANIVRSMKEFSHPDTDEMQPVDLNNALQNTLTVCRNEWKYVANIVKELDPNLPLVNCLPAACNQVFLNLLINAAHAIGEKHRQDESEKGMIAISTSSSDEWVEVRISDNGTGIALENQSKVFDPFFTTKEVGRGTGQGLAIARSVLVDKHRGSLTFDTKIGHGTTFIVRLPRRHGRSFEKGPDHA